MATVSGTSIHSGMLEPIGQTPTRYDRIHGLEVLDTLGVRYQCKSVRETYGIQNSTRRSGFTKEQVEDWRTQPEEERRRAEGVAVKPVQPTPLRHSVSINANKQLKECDVCQVMQPYSNFQRHRRSCLAAHALADGKQVQPGKLKVASDRQNDRGY